MQQRLKNAIYNSDAAMRIVRPVKKSVENVISVSAVFQQRSVRQAIIDLGPQATQTYVLGNGSFGSLGDQALAAGTEALAGAKQVPVSILIPGDLKRWEQVGFTQIQSLEPYANIRKARVTSKGQEAFCRSNVIVVGADTIDGKYEHPFLAMRVNALNMAAANGHTAKLVNFSISDTPTRLSLYLLRKLRPEVEFWARDRYSQERANRFLSREINVAPDVALAMEAAITPNVSSVVERRRGKPFAVLVPNGHMSTVFNVDRAALRAFWVEVARELAVEYDIVVMPHDVRPRHDDPGFALSIVSALRGGGVNAELFSTESAAEAKGLLSFAAFSVSGRMHACVAAMSSGTPAIGLDYLQKFQGQFNWYPGLGRTIDFDLSLNKDLVMRHILELLATHSRSAAVGIALSADDIGWL